MSDENVRQDAEEVLAMVARSRRRPSVNKTVAIPWDQAERLARAVLDAPR